MEDTIATISTALGVGAISIIRLTGSNSISIINKIFDRDLTHAKSHTIHYGHIIDKNEIIDEVLVSVMLAPKTYTKEDVIEINCHGGIITTNKILELVLNAGARLAEPGEFTKRAFLNGRIDLTQAEGIMNLIESKSDIARKMSINQLTGSVSNIIRDLRKDISDIISNIEVNIDYPEYEDIEVLTTNKILPELEKIKEKLLNIIKKSQDGKLINDGLTIGIVGRPNVGKSSLLNALLEEEKAIVTDIEGTTRDIVEGKITLNGIICNFIDTAGIRETENIVEKIGVNKSLDVISSADLIILLLNNNENLTEEDKELLTKIKNKKHIIVVNKIDLEKKLLLEEEHIELSVKNNLGIEKLKKTIVDLFNLEQLETQDQSYLCNARSISLLKNALLKLENCIKSLQEDIPLDIAEIDILESWNLLGEIIGETYTDELVNEIFSRFCLGK